MVGAVAAIVPQNRAQFREPHKIARNFGFQTTKKQLEAAFLVSVVRDTGFEPVTPAV